MNDYEFLKWIYLRLKNKYGENPQVDYMQRLLSILATMPMTRSDMYYSDLKSVEVARERKSQKDTKLFEKGVNIELKLERNLMLAIDDFCEYANVDRQSALRVILALETFKLDGQDS